MPYKCKQTQKVTVRKIAKKINQKKLVKMSSISSGLGSGEYNPFFFILMSILISLYM